MLSSVSPSVSTVSDSVSFANHVNQMSQYIHSCYQNVISQLMDFRFRAIICLNALSLELSQSRNVVTHVFGDLNGQIQKKDDVIDDLQCQLKLMETELIHLKEKEHQNSNVIKQLKAELHSAYSHIQVQDSELESLTQEKENLEMDVARLKQAIHLSESSFPDAPRSGINVQSGFHGANHFLLKDGVCFALPVFDVQSKSWIFPSRF